MERANRITVNKFQRQIFSNEWADNFNGCLHSMKRQSFLLRFTANNLIIFVIEWVEYTNQIWNESILR